MAFSLLRVVRASTSIVESGILGCGINHFESGTKQMFKGRGYLQKVLLGNRTSAMSYSKQAAGSNAQRRGYQSDSESDSDSDDERTERGTSEFWRRKIRSFHGVIDINKDGVVSYEDFTILADRFIQLGHLTTKQKADFVDALKHVWEEQWGIVDKYNMVTSQQYLENMHHIMNDKSLKRKAHRFLPYLFQAVDKDKSGSISISEFKLFFECLGLNPEDAHVSFTSIDNNLDGFISLKEFVKHGRDYFLTEDEKRPSKHFWGPLVKP